MTLIKISLIALIFICFLLIVTVIRLIRVSERQDRDINKVKSKLIYQQEVFDAFAECVKYLNN